MTNNQAGTLAEFRQGGWVLLGCFLGIVICAPSIGGYLSGVFLQPLEGEFGWSRTAISLQSLFSISVFAFTAPLAGRIIDKFGVRWIAFLSFILFGIAQYSLSFLNGSLVQYYVLSIIIAVVAAGTTPVVFTKIINAWFDKARGLALGISLLGAGLTATIGPILLTGYVDENGWRAGYQLLAYAVVLGTVIVVLLIRDFPVTVGGDGQQEKDSGSNQKSGMNWRKAIASRSFILIGAAFIMISLSVGGLLLHFIPMMTEYGMTRPEAAQAASLVGLAVLIGRIGTGILIDRYFAPRVALIMVLCAAVGYLALLLGGVQFAFITALAVGFTVGAEIDLIGYLAARYFGLKNYGVIYGILYGITVFGVGIAPLFTGLAFDIFGSYNPAILISAVGLVIAALLFTRMPPFPSNFDETEAVTNAN